MPHVLLTDVGLAHTPTADFPLQGVIATHTQSPVSVNPGALEA